jgi:hypothetical protein
MGPLVSASQQEKVLAGFLPRSFALRLSSHDVRCSAVGRGTTVAATMCGPLTLQRRANRHGMAYSEYYMH